MRNEDAADFATTPIGFAELILGMPLYGWQDETLTWFEDPRIRTKGTLVTPNGSGKSSGVVAGLSLWGAGMHELGTVVITSKDGKQLDNQVWPAIERHRDKFPGWKFSRRMVTTPTGGRIIGFTTDEAGRAEGWHKVDDIRGPLWIVVDEAKTVAEPIFSAFDRCTFNGILYVSSPGAKAGRFYESHTKLAAQFRRRAVSLEECPHIPRDKIDDIITMYGLNHPFTRSAVFGEFMDDEALEEYVFNVTALDRCLRNPPRHEPGAELVAFCDFGKGSAEHALSVRNGNKIERLDAWREADEMAAVGQFIMRFRRYGLTPTNIWGDCGGDIGRKMCDLLTEAGWTIGQVNFGQPATNDNVYISWSAEAWHETAKLVDQCLIIVPDDDVLRAQLTTRKHKINNRGKLELESKHAMKERGLVSPDRADVICGVCAVQSLKPLQPKHHVASWTAEFARMEQGERGSGIAGMDAGE